MQRCLLFLSVLFILPSFTVAQTQTVQEVVEQKDKWEEWIRSEKKLQISGRYDGRFSNKFRLLKLPVEMLPGRTTVLPADVERGQRITVSGIIKRSGRRLQMTVERLAVGSTDSDRLRNRIRRIPKDQPELGFLRADEFAAIAKFYEDEDLLEEVTELRSTTFQRQRKAIGEDADRLLQLAIKGESLGMKKAETDAIRFQSLILGMAAEKVDEQTVLKQIKSFEGWDKPNTFLVQADEVQFLAAPAAQYELAASPVRLRMHRRIYRQVRLPQMLKALKSDGSNGLVIANTLRKELPEEAAEIERANSLYVEFRLGQISKLTRPQLENLATLLTESQRGGEIESAVDKWLSAEEKRLNNGQLDGKLATAEQYSFAFGRWKFQDHKARGDELYKEAYLASRESAPQEAAKIAETLKQSGWIWLNDRWMTVEAVNQMPRNDVEVALGKAVVPGMKVPRVLEILAGPPTRKVRIISSKGVHEIWIYEEGGSESFIVHLLRSRFQSPAEAVVTQVGQEAR